MIEGDFAGQRKGIQHECDGEDAVNAEKKEECFIEGISDAVGGGQGAVEGDEGGDLESDGVVTLEFVEIGEVTQEISEMWGGFRRWGLSR